MSHQIENILQLARLFQLPSWQHSTYQHFNPYLLASLGYRPSAPNLIQCHICLKFLNISEDGSEQWWLGKLRSGHDEDCIYCKEQIYVIIKEQIYLSLEDILSEMNLTKVSQQYPLLDTRAILAFVGVNLFFFKRILNLYDMDINKFQITFLLQMFGWFFTKDQHQHQTITCYFCGRTLPLTTFSSTSSPHQQHSNSSLPQGPLFNPIEEHRYFCLWINSQNHWTLYLQHYQDKFSQTSSFKYKTTPLETQRMRYNIDKYLETTKQKIEAGLQKLKSVTAVCVNFSQRLGKDRTILGQEGWEGRQAREFEKELQQKGQSLYVLLQPLKKIKLT